MAFVLLCESPVIQANDTIKCAAWSSVDYEQIALKSDLFDWETYLGFDLGVFGQVLTGLLLSFISGHVAGVVLRLMNRT
jgi:hypothetical protein